MAMEEPPSSTSAEPAGDTATAAEPVSSDTTGAPTTPINMTLRTLQQYKQLAGDPEKVALLTRDGTVVQFLAYVLEDRDDAIVTAALQTIVLLCSTEDSRRQLRHTYGLQQALECLKMKDSPAEVLTLASEALTQLCRPEPSGLSTLMGGGGDGPASVIGSASQAPRPPRSSRRSKVVTLHVAGLVTGDDREALEAHLVRVRGMVSIVFDMGRGRCTCRVREHVSVTSLAAAVDRTDSMAAYQVVKAGDGEEELVPVSQRAKELERPHAEPLPEYLPEDEPDLAPGAGAVAPDGFFKQASGWISSASSFLGQSFYW